MSDAEEVRTIIDDIRQKHREAIDTAYARGKADGIDEFYKVIEQYIQDINTNELLAHMDNEKMMYDWIKAWKNALYRDLEKLKESKNG